MRHFLVRIGCVLLTAQLCGCKPEKDDSGPAPGAQASEAAAPAPTPPVADPAPPDPGEQPKPTNTSSGPRWACDELVHDFGVVWAGTPIRHPFKFRNVGDEVLKILEAKARCSCSVARNYSRQVVPGRTGVIPFILNTGNKSGAVNEWLTIKTNDPQRPEMKITLTGTVKQVCKLEVISDPILDRPGATPQQIQAAKLAGANFGKIKKNDHLHRVLRLTNTSGAPLSLVQQPSRSGPRGEVATNPRFELELKEIEPGQVFELTIDGKPPFQTGRLFERAVFKTNIPDRPFYTIPITAYLPERIEVMPPKIVADYRSWQIKKRTITITNHGTTPFKVTGMSVSSPDYRLSLRPKNREKPNATVIDVVLPPGEYYPPPWGEVIRITTNDAEKPVIELQVLPDLRLPATKRPADAPLQFYPAPMPEDRSAPAGSAG